jgi:DNA polymerase III delta prime subunit
MLDGDTEQIERVKARFKDQNAVKSAIRKALRENDPRIKEAAQAAVDGKIGEYNRIAEEILNEGYFTKEDIKAAIKSEINDMVEDEKEEADTEQKVSIAEKLNEATDMLLGIAVAQMKARDPMEMDVQEMKDISVVFKNVKDILGIKSKKDLEEQDARIAKLRKEAEREEASSNTEPVRVIIEDDLKKYSQ